VSDQDTRDNASMPVGRSGASEAPLPPEDQSIGQLFGRMSSDLSALFRQEIELAKVEIKEEATKAGKGIGMFGGAGFAGYLAVLLLSLAAAWGLAELVAVGFAFLVVGGFYAMVAGGLFMIGRRKLKSVHGPQQTVQTVKEDVQWAHEQMS
jgi:hypothetical protein